MLKKYSFLGELTFSFLLSWNEAKQPLVDYRSCDNIQGRQNEPELKQKQVTALCTLVSSNQTKSCLRNNRCRGALITNIQHLR